VSSMSARMLRGNCSHGIKALKATRTLPTPGRVISGICDFVCLCVHVRALKEKKRLKLSTPNSEDVQCMAVNRHALILRSNKRAKVKVT